MADLQVFEIIQGEVGKVLNFTLTYLDADDVVQDWSLTGKTIFLRAWMDDPVGRTIDDVACAVVTAATGKGSFTFDVTTAAIRPGEHKYRIKSITTAGGAVRFFPDGPEDENLAWGIINMKPAY